jgi:hypothetical protein
MIRGVANRALLLVVLTVALAACASLSVREQRTLQGPTALEMWAASVVLRTGREPTFDEQHQWDSQMERRISKYLSEHPEIASSPEASNFTFLRQVAVGMTKEQALLLLGPPAGTSTDAAEIEKLARAYWPAVKAGNVTEVWVYHLGWRLYFNGPRIVDITQYLEHS